MCESQPRLRRCQLCVWYTAHLQHNAQGHCIEELANGTGSLVYVHAQHSCEKFTRPLKAGNIRVNLNDGHV